jgi:hypothetical protein
LKLLNEKSADTSDICFALPIYAWQSLFYDKIPESRQKEAHEIWDDIQEHHGDQDWQDRIKKRGDAFCKIVKAWVEYVERTIVVVNEVEWKNIPGYEPIVEALMEELEKRDLHTYSDFLCEATVSFMSNATLLNNYINVVFKKTYAFDAVAVDKTMELTAKWFHKIHRNHALIPPNFDFVFMYKGIQMLLNLDHGTSTAKVIWFLY